MRLLPVYCERLQRPCNKEGTWMHYVYKLKNSALRFKLLFQVGEAEKARLDRSVVRIEELEQSLAAENQAETARIKEARRKLAALKREAHVD